jgi:hydrogenase small subunit
MSNQQTFLEALQQQGISRRAFLKFAAITASSLALSAKEARVFAAALASAPRPTVIWLSFQQCTGCSESILRSYNIPAYTIPGDANQYPGSASIESLILGVISLDYHETLQVAAGDQAEKARKDAMAKGGYVLIVDGSIPHGETEFWSCAAGNSNLNTLKEAVQDAALVVALGTCAAYGGIPAAAPNPTNASGYGDLVDPKKLGLITADIGKTLPPYVNISGCPPMAEVITGTIAYFLAYGALPPLEPAERDGTKLMRPLAYYGTSVHDTCPRHEHWVNNEFAASHGDDNAKKGWCLLHIGCRGPEVRNACTKLGWNKDPADNPATILKNSPMHTGHGCIGCSEPKFWDTGLNGRFSKGFYTIQQ